MKTHITCTFELGKKHKINSQTHVPNHSIQVQTSVISLLSKKKKKCDLILFYFIFYYYFLLLILFLK